MVKPFRHRGNPALSFGAGCINELPSLLPESRRIMVLTGGHFTATAAWSSLESAWKDSGISYTRETVSGEPSPESVDALSDAARAAGADAVVAIGGGSVLDAGKAVAAMLRHQGSVFDYLEGVGTKEPEGRTVPMIAVPTTAGTGSEATKNAVISRRGESGFKKSLRHDAFVPSAAVIDPELAVGCPPGVSLACGMDAFSQLLESFVSTGATPMTDALAREGLSAFGRGSRLFAENRYGSADEAADRGELALAAYFSGLTLANAGLGTVHGMAGPLGGFCDVPHGVACAILAGPVFRRITAALPEDDASGTRKKLAFAGCALFGKEGASADPEDITRLLDRLDLWSAELPRLSAFGLRRGMLDAAASASGNKSSPVALDVAERRAVLSELI